MEVKILSEAGYLEALYGCGLSYGLTSGMTFEQFKANERIVSRMGKVAEKLAVKDPSEAKLLSEMAVWIDITAARYWWVEMDTYHVANRWLSASTRHTLGKRELTEDDFETRQDGSMHPFLPPILDILNLIVETEGGDTENLRAVLPESFLQQRIMSTNYLALRNIIRQRRNHKLWAWHQFCQDVVNQVEHPEFLRDLLPEDYE